MLIGSPASPPDSAQLVRHENYIENRKEFISGIVAYVGNERKYSADIHQNTANERDLSANREAYAILSDPQKAVPPPKNSLNAAIFRDLPSNSPENAAYEGMMLHAKQALRLKDAIRALEVEHRCRDAFALILQSATNHSTLFHIREKFEAAMSDSIIKEDESETAETQFKEIFESASNCWISNNVVCANENSVVKRNPLNNQEKRKRSNDRSEAHQPKRRRSESQDSAQSPSKTSAVFVDDLTATPPRTLCIMFNQLKRTLAHVDQEESEMSSSQTSDDNKDFLMNVLEAAGPTASLELETTTSEPVSAVANESLKDISDKRAALAFVYDCLENMEGIFTMKARVYQTYLKAYLPEPSSNRQRYIVNIVHPPRIPANAYEEECIARLRKLEDSAVPQKRFSDNNGVTDSLENLLTSIVNKAMLLLIVEHGTWYIHAPAREQLTGHLLEYIWPERQKIQENFRQFFSNFVEVRVRHFRDSVARHFRERAKHQHPPTILPHLQDCKTEPKSRQRSESAENSALPTPPRTRSSLRLLSRRRAVVATGR